MARNDYTRLSKEPDLGLAVANAFAEPDEWGERGGHHVPVRTDPLPVDQARELAERMHREQRNRHDRGYFAAAIPVTLPTRKVPFAGVSGTDTPDGQKTAVAEHLAATGALKPGETVESVWVTVRNTHHAGGRGPGRFRDGSGTATVRKAAFESTRTVTVTAVVPGDPAASTNRDSVDAHDRVSDARDDAIRAKVALKARERVSDIRVIEIAPTYKTVAVAGKGKTVTRYVVSGSREHATWQTGLPSQSAARAHALDVAAGKSPSTVWDTDATFEVTAVTRREDGSPLVSVTRELTKTTYTAEVTVTRDERTGPDSTDGWLLLGAYHA